MISIIVPVYNTEKYLQRCIDSILEQSYIDFEVLLINDGSTDASRRICDKNAAKDSRVRVFHKENGGVSSARNVGLDNAKGEWITFVDSDDYVLKNYLHNYVCQINDKVDIVCQGVIFDKLFSEQHPVKYIGTDYVGNVQNGIVELYKHPLSGVIWNKCFKAQIIKDQHLRFNKNITYREDEIFVLSYLKYCKLFASSKECGYFYFIPQWGAKYKNTSNYYLTVKEIYKLQLEISSNGWNSMLTYTLYELTTEFINTLPNSKNKRTHILDYKKSVGKNILSTQLFTLSKWIIFLDKTGCFSTLFLMLHLYLKLMTNKKLLSI